uniref:Uncharacterized protein n=1 Tax=Arundo donax TaxID=35708 RepID=A0A0A9BFP5_ARUDO
MSCCHFCRNHAHDLQHHHRLVVIVISFLGKITPHQSLWVGGK